MAAFPCFRQPIHFCTHTIPFIYNNTQRLHMTEYMNIRLEKGIVAGLKKKGTKGETYNEIISRLLVDATEAKQ